MKPFKPDFERFRKVLTRDGEPDMIPFYDLYADREIMEAVVGKPYNLETHIEFQVKMGYDYINAGIHFGYPRDNVVHTADTASLNRGERHFVDDNHGMIETRADFDAYPWPSPTDPDQLAAGILRAQALLPEGMKIALGMPAGIFENVIWLMGCVPMSFAQSDDPALVSDMFERIGTNHVKALRMVFEKIDLSKIGLITMGDDLGHATGTMFSPEFLRKYVFPWQKQIADLAHEKGLPMMLHSCGNLEAIMDDLIDYVGIDAKQSYEDKIMPVTEVKRKYGHRIAILGGVDVHKLCTLDEDALRAYVRNIISVCGPGGGYAMGTGNTVANYIPLKNFYIMCEETRKLGVYPIRI